MRRSTFATLATSVVSVGLIAAAAADPPEGETTTEPETTLPIYKIACGAPSNGASGAASSNSISFGITNSNGPTTVTWKAYTPKTNIESTGDVPAQTRNYSVKPRYHDGASLKEPGPPTEFEATLPTPYDPDIANAEEDNPGPYDFDYYVGSSKFRIRLELVDVTVTSGGPSVSTSAKSKLSVAIMTPAPGDTCNVNGGLVSSSVVSGQQLVALNAVPG